MSDSLSSPKRPEQDWTEHYPNIDTHLADQETTPRDSVSTYASTTRSTHNHNPPPESQNENPDKPLNLTATPSSPRYEVPDREELFPTDALASTPSSFATLFPSTRRLLIRHDDATVDGNMNLRVDTLVHTRGGFQQDVILFHLRMYDLFERRFSLRRHCRESGREVCHSARKEVSSPIGRGRGRGSVLRKSWGDFLAGLRPGSSGTASGSGGGIKRRDSGYESGRREHHFTHQDGIAGFEQDLDQEDSDPVLSDTILLEFSNYAHVDLSRHGSGPNKRYEYEYWSTKYQWRRESRKEGDLRLVSYHLINTRTARTIAHLVPEIMTPLEELEEESKGGWVPPCSLWICDEGVYERMADVAE